MCSWGEEAWRLGTLTFLFSGLQWTSMEDSIQQSVTLLKCDSFQVSVWPAGAMVGVPDIPLGGKFSLFLVMVLGR